MNRIIIYTLALTFSLVSCGGKKSEAEKWAEKTCDCGSRYQLAEKVAEARSATGEEQIEKAKETYESLAKMLSCMGGENKLEEVTSKMSDEKRKAFDEELETLLTAQCPEILGLVDLK